MPDKNLIVEVRIDSGAGNGVPHAFIVLTDEFGNQQGYGFAPSEHLNLWGPGEISNNTNHAYDKSWSYDLNQEQYDNLNSFIYQQQRNPGIYEGWNRNCVNFVSSALRYAGIDDLQSAPLTHPVELWWRQNFISYYSNGKQDLANLGGDYDQLGNFISNLQNQYQIAKTTVSPLILDLDGDGIETISKSAGIHFDHDANQFAETTGWVGKDDGLLVWDRNNNGRIDDGSELFGNNTLLTSGSKAANGFAALAELDTNRDNKIDSSDTAFTQLRLWKDADSNAELADDELLSLDSLGVQSFNLSYKAQTFTDAQGNQHLQVGSYTRVDDSVRAMDDVWFAADTARTIDQSIVDIDAEIAALPDLQGFGNVHSLHQAMARDQSGKLKALVQAFASEDKGEKRILLMQSILFLWTGSDGYAANSRGAYFGDARKLYVLEAFLGERFIQGFGTNAGTNDPGPEATKALMSGFDDLSTILYGQLMLQTQFKNLFDSIKLKWDANSSTFKIDVSSTLAILQTAAEKNISNAIYLIGDFGISLNLCGDFGKNVLESIREKGDFSGTEFSRALATIGKNYFSGNDSNNTISGNLNKENLIYGFGGNDKITGGDSKDIIVGGIGNDLLSGGKGNDFYLFSAGDDNDLISDYDTTISNNDIVRFTDVASTDIQSLQRLRDDLIFNYGTADQITVINYFSNSYYRIEQFSFADGVSWDDVAIKTRTITTGTAGGDYIYGYNEASNVMSGFDGNDSLYGGAKDDRVDGGNGNDRLNGYAGNDMLLGGLGNDVLYGDAGDDWLDGSSGNDWLSGDAGNDTLLAGEGDDTLNGGTGNDLLDAGTGNDVMEGGSGNDTYLLRDAGSDRITDSDGIDSVQFNTVASSDVTAVERRVNDLVLRYGSTDQLTVTNYFNGSNSRLEQFAFADGVSWDDVAIKTRTITTGTAGGDYIYGYNEASNFMNGFDGNDSLYGGARDDQLDGGNGNDTLYGYAGNDILQGKAGADTLNDTVGNNLFNGGSDNDLLNGGAGNELFIGGPGNDIISTGSGADIIAFNRGDGQDTILASTGKDNTISLGKGIAYADVLLSKSGSDLVLATGQNEQITLKNWYSSSVYRSIANLQFVTDTSTNYAPDSTDSLLENKIQTFNFDKIVSHFDQAQSANAGVSSWALTSALLDAHLASSDLAGLGGELTYGYGKNSNLSDISVTSAQALLGSSQFGMAAQNLQVANALPSLSPRLV